MDIEIMNNKSRALIESPEKQTHTNYLQTLDFI